jgi:hypothetical protein
MTKPKQPNYQPARRKHMKPIISLLWGLFLLVICHLTAWADISAPPQNIQLQIGSIPTTKSITQYGITWTFADPVRYGQFVNGDYWVVDPGNGVKIVKITPGDAIREGTSQHMNGSMLNPHTSLQGYDGQREYDATKNVNINISPGTPLVLSGDISLVSTISNITPEYNISYVKTAAVLTCLTTAPPAGSFRPGISSTTKTLHNISSVNRGLLKNLPSPITKPDISIYAGKFQMVFLDHGDWTTRFMKPSDSGLNNYYFPTIFAEAALVINMDYTAGEKETLLINSIQQGIDLYSFIESGTTTATAGCQRTGWEPNGGINSGRKWSIMFAGIMLNYPPMRDIGQKSGDYLYADGYGPGNPPPDYIHFQEDGQTFYVTRADIDITSNSTWVSDAYRAKGTYLSFDIATNIFTPGSPGAATVGPWYPDTRNDDINGNVLCRPYNSSLLGMPEWGIRHSTKPYVSDASWGASYRKTETNGPAWAGTTLAARIMGYKNQWNNNALFDFTDRYAAISAGKPDPFGYKVANESTGYPLTGLTLAMWETYRGKY